MILVTAKQMRKLDFLSIERDGIPSLKLMENAGSTVCEVIKQEIPDLKKKIIIIICGLGNNGGDGLVVLRHLLTSKYNAVAMVVGKKQEMSFDALVQLKKLKAAKSKLIFCTDFDTFIKKWKKNKAPQVMVDALFGTGLSRKVEGLHEKIICFLNEQKIIRVSVDIPSGLSADHGKPLGTALHAEMTVTFEYPKIGFFSPDGVHFVGKLFVKPIGISVKAKEELEKQVSTHVITKKDTLPLLVPRSQNTHKGTLGHVFVVGASKGKVGAGVMASFAALRAGAGLSTLVLPEAAYQKIDRTALEIMATPIADLERGFFVEKNLPQVLDIVSKASVVALGPGLGTEVETQKFVQAFLKNYEGPLVLDADGINAIWENPLILKSRKAFTLLTPHPGEMASLVQLSIEHIQANRIQVARDFASHVGCYLLLKGFRSVLAFPDGQIFINPTGNPAMASAGQGDVLTGLYAGLLSQYPGHQKETLLFGCFLHGLVGDLLAKKGQRVVMAMDIAHNLHLGYQFLRKKSKILSTVFY